MGDGPSGGLSRSDRLDLLQKKKRGWQAFPPKPECINFSTIKAASRGVLAYTLEDEESEISSEDTFKLKLWQLPSERLGNRGKKWDLSISRTWSRFAIDPSQDLLVAVELDEAQ